MKKFLLLCGVAAITATSVANYVNAGAITEDFNVGIKMVSIDSSLEKVQDLHFGVTNFHRGGDKYLTLSTDGTINGNMHHYGRHQIGIVTSDGEIPYAKADVYDIVISGAETLKTDGNKICGHVKDWQKEKFSYTDTTEGYTNILGFKIGATFYTATEEEWGDDWEDVDIPESADCTATATATLIYTGALTNGNSGSGE